MESHSENLILQSVLQSQSNHTPPGSSDPPLHCRSPSPSRSRPPLNLDDDENERRSNGEDWRDGRAIDLPPPILPPPPGGVCSKRFTSCSNARPVGGLGWGRIRRAERETWWDVVSLRKRRDWPGEVRRSLSGGGDVGVGAGFPKYGSGEKAGGGSE